MVREIVFYKGYFEDFFETLTEKVKDKIDEVLFMITVLERIPSKFFKSIEGVKGLFEIRVEYEGNIYGPESFRDVVSTKGIWWCFSTGFKRKPKKHRRKN